ncbi:MAG: alpha-ketoglutarate-dependent dioxygenase AlkB [Leptospiraceae bacterium]|nr:alpha-ketoglutarate-dependent dioxygenase AlkB [Leptospiraceae bacterium]MDW8305617.1 alpha-ketoglutarate-dependent dioxygenase AlkB [Leptospiraceae bacterium]
MNLLLFPEENPLALTKYEPNFLSKEENRYFFQLFRQTVSWQRPTLIIHGRRILQPRLSAWYGDKGSDYVYSGVKHEVLPWTKELWQLKTKVEEYTGFGFNSVLLNYYRDGNDAVSWHADDETNLHPLIASLSLGEGRYFYVKPKLTDKQGKRQSYKFWLEGGSLLVMLPGFQERYLHAVLRMKNYPYGRINLTFRKVVNQ